MKIQCNCGAKYAFDVTPDLLANPIKLVCPTCGLDLSDYINQLVQKELAGAQPAIPKPVPIPVPIPVPVPVPASTHAPVSTPAPSTIGQQLVPPPAPTGSRLRIGGHKEAAPEGAAPVETAPTSTMCLKHGQLSVANCAVCKKPICPRCMDEFGYLCSSFCKNKAENDSRIVVPVFENQKSRVEARYWQKIGMITAAIAVVILGLVSLWTWYCWVGSVPHVKYAAKFPDESYGETAIPEKNQLVLLRGRTLARHDVGKKKEMWSRPISEHDGGANEDSDPFEDSAERPRLRVRGRNIWVQFPNKLVRYDWDTGQPVQEILNKAEYGDVMIHGDEVQLIGFEPGKYTVIHVNLVTADSHVEEINAAATPALTLSQGSRDVQLPGASSKTVKALNAASKGFNPADLEQHIQALPLPARIALPAVLAISSEQERALNEIASDEGDNASRANGGGEDVTLKEQTSFIAGTHDQLQVRIKLLEKNIVERTAMKARPKKSALDGVVNQAATADVANEIFNDMQRDKGLDKVLENQSRYQVALHRLDVTNAPDWKGEVIGPPSVFPLDTVNIVGANKTVLVFDKMNKLLWAVTNTFNMIGDRATLDPADALSGLGPVVERNGTLYVADQGVLTAFELASGNARWRLPTVGVAGIVFDDSGMLYANSTTASPDTIQYSKQIDITRKTEPVILKIDPATGKTLWTTQSHSWVAYASGKFLYSIQLSQGGSLPGVVGSVAGSAFETSTIFGLRRLNPSSGNVIWQYFQKRYPMNITFDKNTIQLLFPKEVQVLRYLTF